MVMSTAPVFIYFCHNCKNNYEYGPCIYNILYILCHSYKKLNNYEYSPCIQSDLTGCTAHSHCLAKRHSMIEKQFPL